jgi:hypothetical protein
MLVSFDDEYCFLAIGLRRSDLRYTAVTVMHLTDSAKNLEWYCQPTNSHCWAMVIKTNPMAMPAILPREVEI